MPFNLYTATIAATLSLKENEENWREAGKLAKNCKSAVNGYGLTLTREPFEHIST